MLARIFLFPLLACLVLLSGCSSIYYNTMEQFGTHKRDILQSRVKDARKDQEKAKEEFASAFDEFKALVKFDGGNLEKQYNKLNGELEDCESRAKAVHDRVNSIEDVGGALFREWEKELTQYKRDDLRAASAKQLRSTRTRYDAMLSAMRGVETKMDPVLEAFRDQVLFLKHNLNAQAVASLEGTLGSIESDVDLLIKDMDKSIKEADVFLKEMKSES
jgi:phage shock protein A